MALEDLLRRIGDVNDFSRPRPLVTIEEFFDGNDDPDSLGYDLPDPPAPAELAAVLREIAVRPDVADVRIQVEDRVRGNGWPTTDGIWIVTSAPLRTVRTWLPQPFEPDGWSVGDPDEEIEPLHVPVGMQAVLASYD